MCSATIPPFPRCLTLERFEYGDRPYMLADHDWFLMRCLQLPDAELMMQQTTCTCVYITTFLEWLWHVTVCPIALHHGEVMS